MKFLIASSFLASSLSVNAADLLTYTQHSGFSPVAFSVKVAVSEEGKITRVRTQGTKVTKENLGVLSSTAVQSLKDKVGAIDDDAKLVDSNPSAPKCMDAPSSSISVNKSGKVITLKSNALCHTSVVKSIPANDLNNVMEGLRAL